MFEAARVDDKLYHSSALAGFIIGSIIGAAVILRPRLTPPPLFSPAGRRWSLPALLWVWG
ncbi:hypothetical protein DBO95_01155 [Yersinia pestis]|nr:hypothetical protein DBO95_01155 [Yersinia pestis]